MKVPNAKKSELKIKVNANYLLLPVKEGEGRRRLVLSQKGEVLRYMNVDLSEKGSEAQLFPVDIHLWKGQTLELTLLEDDFAEFDLKQIVQSNEVGDEKTLYSESLRPQFHFTAPRGWLNDPNGLIYNYGVYHLFYQHNPYGTNWGNMSWGHATSKNLLQWDHKEISLEQDEFGAMFSGTAIIDKHNSAGFGKNALIAFYTAEGGCGLVKAPSTQCMAYSLDNGETFTKYEKNPILKEIKPANRDPKVFWHEKTQKWVMVLYIEGDKRVFQFFTSENLKDWTLKSELEGFHECPDLFPIDDKWILFGAHGYYYIGDFDGENFHVESGFHTQDFGPHYFAAQTYNETPDGRRILLAWMESGKYEGMPFNQQMTFPCELTIKDGRLCKNPIHEIEQLVVKEYTDLKTEISADCIDALFKVEIKDAKIIRLNIRGIELFYFTDEEALVFRRSPENSNARIPLPMIQGRIELRFLFDRSSVELFANEGRVSYSVCHIQAERRNISFGYEGGEAVLDSVKIRELKSIW